MSTEQVDKFEAAFLRRELEDMAEEKERQYNRAEKAEARVKELEKCVAECLLLLVES